MTSTMTGAMTRVRLAVAAAVGAAAIAAPLIGAFGPAELSATGNCLAWVGSRDDGQCIGYSNGAPTYVGTPNFGIWGPGLTSGPLMPGTTINQGINP